MARVLAPEHIKDLVADPTNRRKHNPRNIGMVVDALHQVGAARSIVIDEDNVILAGNGVTEAAAEAGITKVRVIEASGDEIIAVRRTGLTAEQKRKLAMFDNRTGELSEWDLKQLELDEAAGLDLKPFFFENETAELFGRPAVKAGKTDPDDVPEPRRTSIKAGDLFALGSHRLLCGDTTDEDTICRLLGDVVPDLLHADPPYGMGKESDGIANDNLYDDKLAAFQMSWWSAWTKRIATNASAYIWGNAPDLWRLWWRGGLGDEPELMVRNEIVWDKGSGFGMASEGAHSFPPATERCLFLMRGQQFLGNQNKADFWDGYEPLRAWLDSEREKAGWSTGDVNKLTNTHMAGHWFSRSQFMPISRTHYDTLSKAANSRAFNEPYEHLFDRLFPSVKSGGNAHRRDLSARMRETRTFFDNAHEPMTDVWNFPRVNGAERFDHATPKPVAMAARAIRSSCPEGGAVAVPFGGTCPEMIASEQLERACFALELVPEYCQVIIDRWEAFTGLKATRVADVRPRLRKQSA